MRLRKLRRGVAATGDPANLERMSTSLHTLATLLPAASVVIIGIVTGFVLARHDNKAEERFDP